MNTFLSRLVDDLLASEIALEKQCLILPSRRAITFFKKKLSEKIERPVFLPRIFTLDDLARKVTGKEALDPVSAGLELYAVYHDLFPDAEGYEVFESWIGAILKDFNTIDTYLIDAEKLYTDLRNLKEINEWSFLEEELGAHQQQFNQFWKRLGPLYAAYNERLASISKGYSGAIIRDCAESMGKSDLLKDYKQVTIAGFNALSPAEVSILDAIHAQDKLKVFWDDAPFYTENRADPAGLFMRRWKQKDWNQEFSAAKEEEKQIHLSGHPHAISQVTWAGSLLAELDEDENTVLVLADESLLRPLLDFFPKNLDKVNITIGLSFKDTTVFQFLAGYFRMIIQAEQSESSRGTWAIHHREWRNWIETGSHFRIFDKALIRKVETQIQKDGIIFFDAAMLTELIGTEKCQRYGLQPQNVQSSSISAQHLLADIQSVDHILTGVAERLSEILEDSGSTISAYDFIDRIDTLWRCLKGSLSRERISFIGEPLEGLQVMGLLETRALDFDRLIMLGANEGNLPKGRSYDTFLPYDLRKHYQLPTQQEEDAIFAYYFYRSIQRAQRVDIAYTSERDELGGGEQSRYLSQLLSGIPQEHGLKASVDHVQYAVKNADVPHVQVQVQKSEEVQDKVRAYYRKGVSFSRISEYSRCPLDFYYRTVLGLGEQAEIEEELGSSDLGNLVHEVLDRSFSGRIGKAAIQAEELQEMQSKSPALLDHILAEEGMTVKVQEGESALVKAVASHMLENFWKREKARLTIAPVKILHLEEDWEFTEFIPIGGEPTEVRFKAKLDRVEQAGEEIRLLDYKTGKVATADVGLNPLNAEQLFDVKKLKALQLLYYTWFYWKKTGVIAKAGIISLIGLEEEPLFLKLEKSEIPNEEQLQEFEALLYERLEEIASEGEFEHDIEQGFYCSHCIEKAERSY